MATNTQRNQSNSWHSFQPNNFENSLTEQNFFGYRLIDNATGKTAHNVTAGFRYRGYEIAFHTWNPAGAKVNVLMNHVFIGEFGTVEAAIAAVNERCEHASEVRWTTGRGPVRSIHRSERH
jgi:hypothetical protein